MEPTADAEVPRLAVSVEEEGPVLRTLSVELPSERVDAAFARAYRELARRTRVRGFRPGRAPRSVLERLYGASVAEDLERVLVEESLPEALSRGGLEPVARPRVEAPTPAAGTPFRYRARVEVRPVFELPALSGLPARRPPVEVGVAEVEQELEALRQRHAQLVEEPEGTAARPGHVLALDFEGRVDGRPFEGGSGRGADVELGSGRFLPGFEDQLVGAQAGETREVRCRLPEEPAGPHAGREVLFAVRVHAVRRREVPELDDEFAKDLELQDLAQLRERVRAGLEAARRREADEVARRSVLDALLERTPFEVPAGLVELRLERRLARVHRELEGSLPHDSLHAQLARLEGEWRPLAEREAREELALDAVVRARGIAVEEAELEARLDALAGGRAGERERLRRAYAEQGLIAGLRAALAREKALDFLLAEARVEEKSDT
jgi:trigger factor